MILFLHLIGIVFVVTLFITFFCKNRLLESIIVVLVGLSGSAFIMGLIYIITH